MKLYQEMTEEELRSCLLTQDGSGKFYKENCLNELTRRPAIEKANLITIPVLEGSGNLLRLLDVLEEAYAAAYDNIEEAYETEDSIEKDCLIADALTALHEVLVSIPQKEKNETSNSHKRG